MQIICEPTSICLFSIEYWLHLHAAFLMSNIFFFVLPLFIATNPSSFPRRQWQPTPVLLPGESQWRGAWWVAVYGVAQSQTQLKRLSSSSSSIFLHPAHAYVLSCDPRTCSPPGSSLHGIFQARRLEWVDISFFIMSNNFLFCTQT